jgi:membrane-bound metal-dependent hydrolase YbcI (DUF457 family)
VAAGNNKHCEERNIIMFAINHAATALIIKKAYPDAPIAVLLVSVQLIEIFWVILNFLGIEKTRTKDVVRTVKDVELAYMPFSHSIATTAVLAAGAWVMIALGFGRVDLGAAVALGIVSHLVLDLISHARDIALVPFLDGGKFGVGLYERPAVAFVFETVYGTFCWWIYGGSSTLLGIIVLFNLANASLFLKSMPGPEKYLAHRPLWIAGVVAFQIIVTGVLVGMFS